MLIGHYSIFEFRDALCHCVKSLKLMHFAIFNFSARYYGEITRGKVSLGAMGIDPKSLFYQRKLLLKKGLLKKQVKGD